MEEDNRWSMNTHNEGAGEKSGVEDNFEDLEEIMENNLN